MRDNIDLMLAKANVLHLQSQFQEVLDITKGYKHMKFGPSHSIFHVKEFWKLMIVMFRVCPFIVVHYSNWEKKTSYSTWPMSLLKSFRKSPSRGLLLELTTFWWERTQKHVDITGLKIRPVPFHLILFSKSTSLDLTFGPAWIGFAHSFAFEGEHDQAISAYSTASRLFSG